jgi:hypothetical protein
MIGGVCRRSVMPRTVHVIMTAARCRCRCVPAARSALAIGDQFTSGLGGARRIDAYVGEETGPEFIGSDWCLTLGAATIQTAASEVGRGAWTSAVYRGCQGRRRGHQPGTARRYSSYSAPNRLCSSGCSNP